MGIKLAFKLSSLFPGGISLLLGSSGERQTILLVKGRLPEKGYNFV